MHIMLSKATYANGTGLIGKTVRGTSRNRNRSGLPVFALTILQCIIYSTKTHSYHSKYNTSSTKRRPALHICTRTCIHSWWRITVVTELPPACSYHLPESAILARPSSRERVAWYMMTVLKRLKVQVLDLILAQVLDLKSSSGHIT
jgi:hypothetical protein